jgi:hypothetical protein
MGSSYLSRRLHQRVSMGLMLKIFYLYTYYRSILEICYSPWLFLVFEPGVREVEVVWVGEAVCTDGS